MTITENQASLYASWVQPASPESYGRWYFNWFYWFERENFGTESFPCGPPSDTDLMLAEWWHPGYWQLCNKDGTAAPHQPLFSKTIRRIWIKYILKETTLRHEFNYLNLLYENVFLLSFYVKIFHPVIVKKVCSSWSWHLSGGKEGLFILMKSSLNACACISRTVCVRQRCPFKKNGKFMCKICRKCVCYLLAFVNYWCGKKINPT